MVSRIDALLQEAATTYQTGDAAAVNQAHGRARLATGQGAWMKMIIVRNR